MSTLLVVFLLHFYTGNRMKKQFIAYVILMNSMVHAMQQKTAYSLSIDNFVIMAKSPKNDNNISACIAAQRALTASSASKSLTKLNQASLMQEPASAKDISYESGDKK